VVDVDECAYSGEDPSFRHACVGLAVCANQDCGDGAANPGYDCVCTDYDGYVQDGAHGCADRRPPVLECADKGCSSATVYVLKVLEVHERFDTKKAIRAYFCYDGASN